MPETIEFDYHDDVRCVQYLSAQKPGGDAVARIRHIALSVENPPEIAEYYKRVFGLTEIDRLPRDSGEKAVWLSDGYIFFAILHPDQAGTPLPLRTGVHHIGFYVEDLEEACQAAERESAVECEDTTRVNRKYRSPDGVMVDLREIGWDERIRAKMPLLQLTPEHQEEAPPR